MPVTQRSDSNGTYYTIGTAAWYGSEGETLRAQGWRYCGLGTYGVITAPSGAPCFSPNSSGGGGGGDGGGNGGDTQPPTNTPGPTSGVPDKACGRCLNKPPTTTSPFGGSTTVAPTRPKPKGFPWWVWVLAALTLAQVIHGRNT